MPTPEQTASSTSITCQGDRFRLYLDRQTIRDRTAEIGQELNDAFEGKKPILIGVLNGAFMFMADLLRTIDIDCEVDFLKLSSYGAEKVSSGTVEELKKVDAELEGRHVIVVEDIVDTGLSMNYILNRLRRYDPLSLTTVTLLHKYEATEVDVDLDHVGFEIDNLFVIGYGMDYAQVGRNIPEIYILDE